MRRTVILSAGVATAAAVMVAGSALLTGSDRSIEPEAGVAAYAQDAELAADGVTVEAVGTIEGTPDTLTAQVGVHVEAASIDDAYTEANTAAAALRDALLEHGVDDADVQTAQLSLGPARHGPEPQDDEPDGYVARTSLRVELHDLDEAATILDAAIDAAGEAATLQGLGFSLDADAALLVDAREAAFAEARAKAEQYAELAGRGLGELVGLSEGDRPDAPVPAPAADAEVPVEAEEAGPPVEPGTEEVQVRVRATWQLD